MRPFLPCLPGEGAGEDGLFDKAARRLVRHLARPSSRRRARHTPPGILLHRAAKAPGYALCIDEKADDLATIGDPEGRSSRGTRDIDGGEHASVQEKATPCAAGIDPNGRGKRGAWDLDRGEGPCGWGAWLPVGAAGGFGGNSHRCGDHEGEG